MPTTKVALRRVGFVGARGGHDRRRLGESGSRRHRTSGLMEFARFDAGAILRKERSGRGPQILRLVVGNPLIMKDMAKAVPDAAAYAPVTILIDERGDGMHLSYDLMTSLLSPYGSQAALLVARDLDTKIEGLLEAPAR